MIATYSIIIYRRQCIHRRLSFNLL